MKKVHHKNCIAFYESWFCRHLSIVNKLRQLINLRTVFDSKDKLYIVMELVRLFTLIAINSLPLIPIFRSLVASSSSAS